MSLSLTAADGGFERSMSLSIGEPYVDKVPLPRGIIKGVKPFLTAPAKSGQLGATFGEGYRKFDRVFEGDSVETIDKINAREKLKSREKFREPYGFKPSSPPKHVFPGAYDGLFTPIRPLGVSACLPRDAIPPHPEPQPKNFRGSCTKKGSFGTAGTTIAPIPEYVPDPYDGPRLERQRRAIAELEASKDKPKYITTCQAAGRTTLDVPEHARTTAGRVFVVDDAVLPPKPSPEAGLNPREVAEKRKNKLFAEQAFIPAKGPKTGPLGTIDKFPERTADPVDPAVLRDALKPTRLLPDAVRLEKAALPATLASRKPLKPSSGYKTSFTPSILKMSVSRSSASLR